MSQRRPQSADLHAGPGFRVETEITRTEADIVRAVSYTHLTLPTILLV